MLYLSKLMCDSKWCGCCKSQQDYVYGHNKYVIKYQTQTDEDEKIEFNDDF